MNELKSLKTDEATLAAPDGRKPYRTPELAELGSVLDITQGAASRGTADTGAGFRGGRH